MTDTRIQTGMKDLKRYHDRLKKILSHEELCCIKKDASTLIEIAYEYIEMGEFKKAFRLFCVGARLNSLDPDVLNGLGVSLCELGKFRISRQILENAVRMYPDNPVILSNLASIYREIGSFEVAIHCYHRAVTLDPSIIEAHLNLVDLYYETGDLFVAYITVLDVLKNHPDNAEAIELRDDILLNIGLSIA